MSGVLERFNIRDEAHEIFALAQVSRHGSIEDAVGRIEEKLKSLLLQIIAKQPPPDAIDELQAEREKAFKEDVLNTQTLDEFEKELEEKVFKFLDDCKDVKIPYDETVGFPILKKQFEAGGRGILDSPEIT